MKSLNKYIRFIKRSNGKEIITALHFFYLLSFAYVLVKFIPLKYYYRKYSFFSEKINIDLQPFQQDFQLLNRMQRYFPVRITCLMQAMAIQSYLKRQGIFVPINLGLNTNGLMNAHAWIGENEFQNEFQIIVR